jgi:hypothetical protein
MALHNNEIHLLSEAWIEHQLLSKETVNEATFWAWERLDELVRSEPEEAWKVIEAIRRANGSDRILGNLAAGPLEDLLANHGDQSQSPPIHTCRKFMARARCSLSRLRSCV